MDVTRDRMMNVYVEAAEHGGWVALPMNADALDRALSDMGTMADRCLVSDIDCEGLTERIGLDPEAACGVGVGALNDLAWLARDLSDFELEAVGTLVNDSCSKPTPLQFANAVIQVDDIPFFDYGPTFDPSATPEENYARMWVDGNPSGLALDLAESGIDCFIDWEALGRDKAMNCVLSDTGYLDYCEQVPGLDSYSRHEVSELASAAEERWVSRDDEER